MRCMDPTPKFGAVLLLLGLVSVLVNASTIKNDFGDCETIVKKWALSSLDQKIKEDKHTLRDLLFFLHVPRTGGRTYFHCFLKKLYSSSLECPRSYDKLRFDPSKQKCRLLVTHDDYSITSKLPNEKTSVVTILRNPVERVFSTYEFSIEVAARFLVHPNLTSVTKMAKRLRTKTSGVSTLDIWPWKYLVPWMREDLFARRDARNHLGSKCVECDDPYNMEDIVMPLHEYINDPVAHDIVHNGATFQVAGLTNNSYFPEAHVVRHCVQKHKILGEHVLQVAKKRLDDMLYVGLTEDHRESATMFANVVGAQVISQLKGSSTSEGSTDNNKSEQSSSFPHPEHDNNHHWSNTTTDQNESGVASTENGEAMKENMTVGELMEVYEGCISSLRKTQARRRTASLKRISPANFSKEARLQVPEVVLEQIKSLNNLDLKLYKYAQDIFAKKHKNMTQKSVDADEMLYESAQSKSLLRIHEWKEELESMFSNSYGTTLWQVLSLAMSVFIFICLLFLFFVNARRKTLKVKI